MSRKRNQKLKIPKGLAAQIKYILGDIDVKTVRLTRNLSKKLTPDDTSYHREKGKVKYHDR